MKIIDILVKKANGELEDGFKFVFRERKYIYKKQQNSLRREINNNRLEEEWFIEDVLSDTVEAIEEQKEIEEFTSTIADYHSKETICQYCNAQTAKINELIRAVNKLTKEREVK